MSAKCGVTVPADIKAKFDAIAGDKQALKEETASFAIKLIEDLKAGGVNDFHLYTLNKSAIASAVTRAVGPAKKIVRAA